MLKLPWSFRLRCWLRRLVLRSSRGVGLHLYRALYALAQRLVVLAVAGQPGVHSLYLRRGAGKGEIHPGVSDLDFAAVVHAGADPLPIRRAYASLASWIPFMEKDINLHQLEELAERANRPPNRYRFAEARSSWQRLHGPNALELLPEWTAEQLWPGMIREVRVWVSLLVEHLVVHPYRRYDDVFRNSLCAKVLGELISIDLAFWQGQLGFSRRRAWGSLPLDHPWRQAVARVEKQRYLSRSFDFAEFTWKETLKWLDDFARRLPSHPYATATAFKSVTLPPYPTYLDHEQPLGGPLRTIALDTQNPPCLQELKPQDAYLTGGALAISLATRASVDEMVFFPSQNPEFFGGGPGCSELLWDFYRTRWGDHARRPDGTTCPARFWRSCRLALSYLELRRGHLVVVDSATELRERLGTAGFSMNQGADALWAAVKARSVQA